MYFHFRIVYRGKVFRVLEDVGHRDKVNNIIETKFVVVFRGSYSDCLAFIDANC